jgi:two-component system nitrate/nitrite response regulator NarL
MIGIGVIDDEQMFVELMTAWIASTGDIDLTTTAVSVDDFLAQSPLPDIVILDLNLRNFTDPADNVARLVEAGLKVIVASIIPDANYIASTTEAATSIAQRPSSPRQVVRSCTVVTTATASEKIAWVGNASARPPPRLPAHPSRVYR